MTGYIYCLRHKPSDRPYVGRTTQSPSLRLGQHASQNTHGAPLLYDLIQADGKDAFSVETLAELEADDYSTLVQMLSCLERYWVLKLGCLAPAGLNSRLPMIITVAEEMSNLTRAKMSLAARNRWADKGQTEKMRTVRRGKVPGWGKKLEQAIDFVRGGMPISKASVKVGMNPSWLNSLSRRNPDIKARLDQARGAV